MKSETKVLNLVRTTHFWAPWDERARAVMLAFQNVVPDVRIFDNPNDCYTCGVSTNITLNMIRKIMGEVPELRWRVGFEEQASDGIYYVEWPSDVDDDWMAVYFDSTSISMSLF